MDLNRPGDSVDELLSRVHALLRPRVGKKMTAVVVKNLLRLVEQGAPRTTVLHAIHQTIDAYARIPESGTPFPLDVARRIADAGCLNLTTLHWKLRWKHDPALALNDDELRAVGQHADALLPSYGEDDAEFALRVAWRCHHHARLRLIVGRATNQNDPTPSVVLHDAWRAQGEPRAAPIGVVPADIGTPGVLYAPLPLVDEGGDQRGRAFGSGSGSGSGSDGGGGFVFSPDHGDNISLDDLHGAQRFFARVPLAITPSTLAWILHVIRIATTPQGIAIEIDHDLLRDWESKEEGATSNAASLLLGIAPDPVEERSSLTLRVGSAEIRYTRGELSF